MIAWILFAIACILALFFAGGMVFAFRLTADMQQREIDTAKKHHALLRAVEPLVIQARNMPAHRMSHSFTGTIPTRMEEVQLNDACESVSQLAKGVQVVLGQIKPDVVIPDDVFTDMGRTHG